MKALQKIYKNNKITSSAIAISQLLLVGNVLADHGQATLITPSISGDGNGIYTGSYIHVAGNSAPHPWYTVTADIGDTITIKLDTLVGQSNTFWVFEVVDNNAKVNDVLGTDYFLFSQATTGIGTSSSSIVFTATSLQQYAIQVDSWLGSNLDYTLEISGSSIPEPTSVFLFGLASVGFLFRRRRAKQ